ncbi:hypothetical protein JTE90_025995 [Oedothorax gibbosus]|uniref:Cytochrome P450 n=1 Tax=Oedothorax gibbosus TaxID=931172 RepID=A0AAV6UGM0_9ARAC|nr:hypothetical protein JTE90_025995 [Oedothorax gibbosus]
MVEDGGTFAADLVNCIASRTFQTSIRRKFLSMVVLTDISVPLAVSVAVAALTCILLDFWRRNRNLPPGPWGLPFVGYYPFLTSQPNMDFAKLSKKYGQVFSFRSGGALFVILNGSKNIRGALVERAEEFIGKPKEMNFLDWVSHGLGVAQEEGSTWKEHRRYFLHTAKNFGFGKQEMEDTIRDETTTLVEDLRKANGQPVHLGLHLDYVVNSVILKVMFNKKLDKNGELFKKLAKAVHALLANIADHRLMLVGKPFQLGMHVLPWATEVRQSRVFLRNLVEEIVAEHVRNFDPENEHVDNYVDSYLYEMEKLRKNGQLQGSSYTMERLIAIAMNMTMEGTGGDTVCSLLTHASHQPLEQKKVQEELDNVLGKDGVLSWQDRKNTPYLEAFIQELYRTAPAFPTTTLYCNFEETKLNGFRIPKRSILIGNLWSINYDPDIYENPTEFNVNRFLNEGGKRIKTDGPYPFSMGKRDCVGQSLAQMEIYFIIGNLLHNFTLVGTDKFGVVKAVPRDETYTIETT